MIKKKIKKKKIEDELNCPLMTEFLAINNGDRLGEHFQLMSLSVAGGISNCEPSVVSQYNQALQTFQTMFASLEKHYTTLSRNISKLPDPFEGVNLLFHSAYNDYLELKKLFPNFKPIQACRGADFIGLLESLFYAYSLLSAYIKNVTALINTYLFAVCKPPGG